MTTKHQNQDHQLRNVSTVSGTIVGASLGLVGGPVGVALGAAVGGVIGAASGVALEHETRELEADDPDPNCDALSAPAIDPPCPDCLAVRRGSAGTVAWCARHAAHHPHGHVHYELPEAFAVGSLIIRP